MSVTNLVSLTLSQALSQMEKENPTDWKGKCFLVPISEINENGFGLSISHYKEIDYEEVQYEKPEIIIEKIEIFKNEI